MLLFGMQVIDSRWGRLFITEGELDAMAMFDYANPAVSLPQGAQPSEREGKSAHDAWIEHDYKWLEAFVEIVLALDVDEPGRKAAGIIAPRLGLPRCRVVEWPEGKKDANECLIAGLEIMDALAECRSLDPELLKSPSDFSREFWEEFFPTGGKEPGDPMPFNMPFRWRDGEVTIWQGYSASGKSVCLGYVLMWLAARYKRRSCIASMEMPAKKTLKNMLRQAMGKSKPDSEDEYRAAMVWMDKFFWVYDHVGDVESKDVLDVFRYAARRYGIKHFVLDSLMKLGDVPFDGYDAQRDLINRLCEFAAEMQVHCHLVCHSRKPDQRHPEKKHYPDKHAVSGHGDITNGVHNVLCVWRNRVKEEANENAVNLPADDREEIRLKYVGEEDTLLVVQKQRETGREPLKRLWFDAGEDGSWQYREESARSVVGFLDVAQMAMGEWGHDV
jgi:twinkle protein